MVSSLLAAPLVLTGLALVGTGVAGSSADDGPGSVTRTLCDATSLDLKATVQFVSFDPNTHESARADGYPTTGFFSYLSLDDAWHVRSYLDSTRFSGMDTEVSFDGSQRFTSRSGETQYAVSNAGEPRSLGMSLPNPLFALASWAMPLNDMNIDRSVKLSDLRALTDAELGIPASAWTRRTIDSVECDVARVRGDVLYGIPYHHEIVVAADDHEKVLRIDRVTKDGVVLTRAEFDDWSIVDQPRAGSTDTELATVASHSHTRLPRTVSLSEFRPADGALLHTITFQLYEMSVNTPVNSRDLWVNPGQAQMVWNADVAEYETFR